MWQMDKNILRVANQMTKKWSCDPNNGKHPMKCMEEGSCDQKGKLSNSTSTSAREVGTSSVVVDMNLMWTEVLHLTTHLWVYEN